MGRIETKRPRRSFAAMASGQAHGFAVIPEPGSPRAIARQMALEGAALLGRVALLPGLGSTMGSDLAEGGHGPEKGRRATRVILVGRPIVASIALCLFASMASAQVSSASPAALGLGENYTAAARGLDAVAWNPATLGLRRDGGVSFVALTVRGTSGIEPITLGNLTDYSNILVPDGVKRDWLARIRQGGGQAGAGGVDVTWAAMQFGPIAVHASTSARVTADVSAGIAELVLFGNVDEAGQAQSLDLSGSSLTGYAFSAIGASYAMPIESDAGHASLGITVKYVLGHAMAVGENSIGSTKVDPLGVDVVFPLVHTDFEGAIGIDNGHGIGIDVGLSIEEGDWTLAGVIQNVSNNFKWSPETLRYRPLAVSLDLNAATTATEDMPLESAPAEVQDRVAGLAFKPVYGAGLAYRYTADLTIMADARFTDDQGILTGPSRHVGAGFEFRVSEWFPVRLGGAMISMGEGANGWQVGGGFGLDLGGWNLSASALRRNAGSLGDATMVMVSIIGAGR